MQKHTADVILRSSDKELFYSWKILLSISSPVFSDMFSLPQPDTSNELDMQHDGRPIIDLEEDSCTLRHILSLCHPAGCTGKQFKVDSIRELRAVLEATTKYDMQNVHSVALEELTNPSFLREDPLRIYAFACQYECREAARLAAKHTLALPKLLRGYVPEFEKIHAGNLCRLLLYREACATAASSLAEDHTWFVHTSSSPLFGCDVGENHRGVEWTTVRFPPSRKYPSGRLDSMSVHTWWLEYMRKAGRALQKSPHSKVVKEQELVDDVLTAISSSKCEQCKENQVWVSFRSFVDMFAEEVNRRVAEVEINLGF